MPPMDQPDTAAADATTIDRASQADVLAGTGQVARGDAFYDHGRDVIAYALSGVVVAVLVWYAAMLVAWVAWVEGGG